MHWQNRRMTRTPGAVIAVSRDDRHRFSKPVVDAITLVENWGVEGDVHGGPTTQHRYLVKKDPGRANLTQVHLIQQELFPELAERGFEVGPGNLGENVTTSGIDLLTLPLGTRLHLGPEAIVEVTGLRSPCSLINKFQAGLMKALIARDGDGHVIRKSGIMGVVVAGGSVQATDVVTVELPPEPWVELDVV